MSEELAREFHETYERLAPSFKYETRPDTREFDPESRNGRLMIEVCSQVFAPSKKRITELEAQAALDKKVAESLCNPNVQLIIEIFARGDIDWANIKRALRAAGYLKEQKDE